jgi:hypothetical protein
LGFPAFFVSIMPPITLPVKLSQIGSKVIDNEYCMSVFEVRAMVGYPDQQSFTSQTDLPGERGYFLWSYPDFCFLRPARLMEHEEERDL